MYAVAPDERKEPASGCGLGTDLAGLHRLTDCLASPALVSMQRRRSSQTRLIVLAGGIDRETARRAARSMFERFTDRSRRVIVLAQEEARMLDHNHIGTEHILLGVIRESDSCETSTQNSLELSLSAVRHHVDEIIGRGQLSPTGLVPFTPRAKKMLALALREPLQLVHNHICTEHI